MSEPRDTLDEIAAEQARKDRERHLEWCLEEISKANVAAGKARSPKMIARHTDTVEQFVRLLKAFHPEYVAEHAEYYL